MVKWLCRGWLYSGRVELGFRMLLGEDSGWDSKGWSRK